MSLPSYADWLYLDEDLLDITDEEIEEARDRLSATSKSGTHSNEAVPSPGFGGGVGTGRGDPQVLRAWMQGVYARANEEMIDEMLENFRTNERELIDEILNNYGHLGISPPTGWSHPQMDFDDGSPVTAAEPGTKGAPSSIGSTNGFREGAKPAAPSVRASSFPHLSSGALTSMSTSGAGFGGRHNRGLPRTGSIGSACPAGNFTNMSSAKCVFFSEMCENIVSNPKTGSWCASGHALCAECTTQYVEKTLLPWGIVWWDRIKCVDPECDAHMVGLSVQGCLGSDLRSHIDAAQLEVVPNIGPEARRERERAARTAEDRESAATVATTTKPCPNCGVATEKNGGCKHITCTCSHEYCWDCRMAWKSGHRCACAPP
ncbi:conserved unknown protein [Ectocarpus siliculosus]|uniref:RBR-type E3 ubiquitin transferase n=1 Tax=Ectocarpus siliculosus TaxID=2880 RepID=D8LB34_ECTSI|nr:conserved unknown protein [Ectocarpus siliculosus]|eukprot:CBN76543.1 conserved unknown protein [Ectocarpus siliculosus]